MEDKDIQGDSANSWSFGVLLHAFSVCLCLHRGSLARADLSSSQGHRPSHRIPSPKIFPQTLVAAKETVAQSIRRCDRRHGCLQQDDRRWDGRPLSATATLEVCRAMRQWAPFIVRGCALNDVRRETNRVVHWPDISWSTCIEWICAASASRIGHCSPPQRHCTTIAHLNHHRH